MNGEKGNACRMLVGKLEGKKPLRRPSCRWVERDVGEIGWYSMDWIDLAQDRHQWRAFMKTVMNCQIP
jgi:hypothetical protein